MNISLWIIATRRFARIARQLLNPIFAITVILPLSGASPAVHLKPGDDVASAVRQAPPGSKFVLSSGVYRLQSIIPKDNDSFTGEGTAILNGSKILVLHPDGQLWSTMEAKARSGPGHCLADHPRCWVLNDLFIDNHLQQPVEKVDDLGPGKWFYDDSSQKVYINHDPTGHTVEFGSTSAAFSGKAIGVDINHLTVEKYANQPQGGAIGGNPGIGPTGGAKSWTVSNVEVRWNHGAGIELGEHARVDFCKIHHNGQKGIGAVGDGDVVTNNEIASNNYAGYNPGWEAGGSKFSKTDHLILRSNYVHDNLGAPGLWADIDNIHVLFEKNRLENNGQGIRHEIGYDAIIRNNLFKGNTIAITVVNSPNVQVYGNVIEVPAAHGSLGIEVYGGARGMGAYGPHVAINNKVQHNIITYLGPEAQSGINTDSGGAISFDYNEYHLMAGGENHWNFHGSAKNLSKMHEQGFESHATVVTAPPKVQDPTLSPDEKY